MGFGIGGYGVQTPVVSVPYGYQDAYNAASGFFGSTYQSAANFVDTANSPSFWQSWTDPLGSSLGFDGNQKIQAPSNTRGKAPQ